MLSAALVKYVLTAAIRDRLLMAVAAIVGLGVCLSLFSASSAVVEQDQFAVVYTASSLRVLGLVGLVLFVVFFIRRSFDARDIEYLLSRPVSRASLILSNACAFSLLALGAGGILALIVGTMAWKSGHTDGVILWTAGVTAEYILIVNVALFFSMVLSSPVTSGMAVLGFYVLARLMGQLLGIIHSPSFHFPGIEILNGILQMVSMFIPRLDMMTQTSWLIYGTDSVSDYAFIMLQTVVFLVLVLSAALIDLVRRQF
jgi:hypothetical protein